MFGAPPDSESRPAIAVVLARAGSKGVPGKNRAPIAGLPCIAWTLSDIRRSRTIAACVVSTDDPEVAAIARGMEFPVRDRPAALAQDASTVDDAARDALLNCLFDHRGRPVVILYANVPVRPPRLIDRAVELLVASGCDSVQSYALVGKFHPWWMARIDAGGRVLPWEGDILNHGVYRRQDLPPAYVPDGGVLVVTQDALFGRIPGVAPGPHAFFGLDRRAILNAEGDVVDIDSPIDLAVADAILRQHVAHPGADAPRSRR